MYFNVVTYVKIFLHLWPSQLNIETVFGVQNVSGTTADELPLYQVISLRFMLYRMWDALFASIVKRKYKYYINNVIWSVSENKLK